MGLSLEQDTGPNPLSALKFLQLHLLLVSDSGELILFHLSQAPKITYSPNGLPHAPQGLILFLPEGAHNSSILKKEPVHHSENISNSAKHAFLSHSINRQTDRQPNMHML